MARVCEMCGAGPQVGNTMTIRGKAKYLGGVGTKVTGISKRQFLPNLQRIRVTVAGTNKTILCCTRCLRSGAVTKRVAAKPFRLPVETGGAAKAKTKPVAPKAKKEKTAPASAAATNPAAAKATKPAAAKAAPATTKPAAPATKPATKGKK
jgi:large subunit ribosomal protein L28